MQIEGQQGVARTIIITREEVLALEAGELAVNQVRLALAHMPLEVVGGLPPKRPLALLAMAITVQKAVLEVASPEELADTEIDLQAVTGVDIDITDPQHQVHFTFVNYKICLKNISLFNLIKNIR